MTIICDGLLWNAICGKKWEVIVNSGHIFMIRGEFKYSLDEKGRLMIPARVRTEILGNALIITRGVEKCLWLFAPEEWKKIAGSLLDSTSLFQEKARLIQRRIIAPAQDIDIDRSGRIGIPSSLRDYAGLHKECKILAIQTYIEIWDDDTYAGYLDETETQFKEAAEAIGNKLAQ